MRPAESTVALRGPVPAYAKKKDVEYMCVKHTPPQKFVFLRWRVLCNAVCSGQLRFDVIRARVFGRHKIENALATITVEHSASIQSAISARGMRLGVNIM